MEHLGIDGLLEFSTEKRIRKKLLSSQKIVAELLCYEPGQGTPQHHHPKQDEIFYVIEGKGKMIIGDEELPVGPTSLVLVPAQVSHGIAAASGSRLVILFIKAPGATSSA